MKINIEVTDTFGHDPNYSWVRRYTIDVPEGTSDYAIVRRVKKHIGWSGMRCVTTNYGDTIDLRPMGVCQVCFITFN